MGSSRLVELHSRGAHQGSIKTRTKSGPRSIRAPRTLVKGPRAAIIGDLETPATHPAGPLGPAPARRPSWGRGGQSLFRRLYLGYVTVIVLVTTVLGILIETRFRGAMELDLRAALERQADHLSELVGALGQRGWAADDPPREAGAKPTVLGDEARALGDLRERVGRLGRATETRLTVVAASGEVLADSSQDPARMDDHGARPEVLEARRSGRGHARRFSSTLGTELVYEARRVDGGGLWSGSVARAALSVETVEAHLGQLRRLTLLGAFGAALLGLLAGLWFSRRASASVAAVTASVEAIARGHPGARDLLPRTGTGNDELGRLVAAVDRMSDELSERMRTISADRNKLLAILGGMVEGVVAVDREERVVHMNAVAGRLLGVSPRECAGKRIWEVTRVVEIPEILERTGSREELAGSVELRVEGSSEPRAIELAASPLFDAAGAVAGAVVVLHDVTELRHLEQVRAATSSPTSRTSSRPR